jgi:molybdopterin-guanine dinucleotide biosynthesis protein
VVVGGSRRKVGKTTIVESLIRENEEAGWTAIKITPHRHPPGRGDTQRYLAAGARCAHLLEHADLPRVPELIASARNVIIESNTVLDFVQPDVCIFISDGRDAKPSFLRHLAKADVVIVSRTAPSRL